MERAALSEGDVHLIPAARMKAIEIANALIVEGMDEGKAIRIAIAKGEEWTLHHGGSEGMPKEIFSPDF